MQNVVDFIIELDKLKRVTRRTKPVGLDRYENTAEHSWQIAMLAASLAPYAAEPVDVNRVVAMLLVHDIGEIDTGDVIFYDAETMAGRKDAERAAVTRIFDILGQPQSSRFLALWLEFEEGATAEARFAHAADRAMPVLLNLSNNGQSWRENAIPYEKVIARVGPPIRSGCPALWTYIEGRLAAARDAGWFTPSSTPSS